MQYVPQGKDYTYYARTLLLVCYVYNTSVETGMKDFRVSIHFNNGFIPRFALSRMLVYIVVPLVPSLLCLLF